MKLNEIITGSTGKFALVGMNSQGKTHALSEFYSKHKKTTIFIENESKADEALKNTVGSSPLIGWLERLLRLDEIKNSIDRQINSVDLAEIGQGSNLTISLRNTVSNFKGLVGAEIATSSNQWGKPGSGETFLGELLLVEQMIQKGNRNPIRYLLIDEPETFLHQSLYRTVCGILCRLSKKMCVVVSTHSADYLKAYCDDLNEVVYVRNGELRQLELNDACVEKISALDVYCKYTDNMDKAAKWIIKHLPDYFRTFIMPKIIECLFCGIAVLGEGQAEEAVFECLQREYATDEALGETSFAVIHGKYMMPAYLSILQSAGVQTVAIFDSDEGKENYWNKALNTAIEELSPLHYSFEEDVEKYLKIERTNNDRNFKSVTSPLAVRMMYLNKDDKLRQLMEEVHGLIRSAKVGPEMAGH